MADAGAADELRLPLSAAVQDTPEGLGGQARLTSRPGRIVAVYPKSGRARVLLESGQQRLLDFVPICIPPWPTMQPGTPVVVDYLRGEPFTPYIVAALDPGVKELSLPTKYPYWDDHADLTNARVWEWVHQLGGLAAQDYQKVFAQFVSWMRMTKDGDILFKHLQELPNPNDALGPGAEPYTRKYFYFNLDATNALTLSWPWARSTKERKIVQSVDDAGKLTVAVTTDDPAAVPVTLSVDAQNTITVDQGAASLVLQNGKATVQVEDTQGGQATVVVSPTELTLQAGTFLLQFKNGQVILNAPGGVAVNAQTASVKASQIVLDSMSVRMGTKSRRVAYRGGAVAPHVHLFSVDGYQYQTNPAGSTIQDGAQEVLV